MPPAAIRFARGIPAASGRARPIRPTGTILFVQE